jgi:hypothetical protein
MKSIPATKKTHVSDAAHGPNPGRTQIPHALRASSRNAGQYKKSMAILRPGVGSLVAERRRIVPKIWTPIPRAAW